MCSHPGSAKREDILSHQLFSGFAGDHQFGIFGHCADQSIRQSIEDALKLFETVFGHCHQESPAGFAEKYLVVPEGGSRRGDKTRPRRSLNRNGHLRQVDGQSKPASDGRHRDVHSEARPGIFRGRRRKRLKRPLFRHPCTGPEVTEISRVRACWARRSHLPWGRLAPYIRKGRNTRSPQVRSGWCRAHRRGHREIWPPKFVTSSHRQRSPLP